MKPNSPNKTSFSLGFSISVLGGHSSGFRCPIGPPPLFGSFIMCFCVNQLGSVEFACSMMYSHFTRVEHLEYIPINFQNVMESFFWFDGIVYLS